MAAHTRQPPLPALWRTAQRPNPPPTYPDPSHPGPCSTQVILSGIIAGAGHQKRGSRINTLAYWCCAVRCGAGWVACSGRRVECALQMRHCP